MTGIIIDKEFDIKKIVIKLNEFKGYWMQDKRGSRTVLDDKTDVICLRRCLFGTSLDCFITISKEGLFRIEVRKDEIDNTSRYMENINIYYLEQLIHHRIIEKELLSVISPDATVVRGIPTNLKSFQSSEIDLIFGIHSMNRHRFMRIVEKELEKITILENTDNIILGTTFSYDKRNFLFNINRRIEQLPVLSNRGIYIVFYINDNSNTVEERAKERFAEIIKTSLNEDSKVEIEFVAVPQTKCLQLLENDFIFIQSTIREKIKSYKEKYENQFDKNFHDTIEKEPSYSS